MFNVSPDYFGFLSKSGCGTSGGKKINVSWNEVASWLFDGKRQSPSNLLKNLVRTQIYRPLFFKHDNYTDFTFDSNKYWCKVNKSIVDHDGIQRTLVFDEYPSKVNWGFSGLSHCSNQNYRIEDNVVTYEFTYDPIQVIDNKFVFQDVQYYVTVDSENKLRNVYYNQFNSNLNPNIGKVVGERIDEDKWKFLIDDSYYTIDREYVLSKFGGDAIQQIVDGTVDISGVKYFVNGDFEHEFNLTYFEGKDVILKRSIVDSSNISKLQDEGLKLEFRNDGTVVVTRSYEFLVKDFLVQEWCAFDDVFINIDGTRTFDWYLANEIVRLVNDEKKDSVLKLGDGNIYKGALYSDCQLTFKNEIQEQKVITKCYSTIDGTQEYLGVLFNNEFKEESSKVVYGQMRSDGLINTTMGTDAFILKNPKDGLNNCNSIVVPSENWKNLYHRETIGFGRISDSGNQMVGDIDVKFKAQIDKVVMTWENDSSSNSYVVSTRNDGLDNQVVKGQDKVVHFISMRKGTEQNPIYDRFIVDLKNPIKVHDDDTPTQEGAYHDEYAIERIQFQNSLVGRTLDFSTQYEFAQLRENLLSNVKSCMTNYLVKTILENTDEGTLVDVGSTMKNLDLCLHLFTTKESLSNYNLTQKYDESEMESANSKFKQIFDNGTSDTDDINVFEGKLYKHFKEELIDRTFNDKQSIVLSDHPSIQVTRVSQVDNFTYEVLFDLNFNVNKRIIKGNDNYNGMYVISQGVVHDVVCQVKFVPSLESELTIKYNVSYHIIKNDNAIATFKKIAYNHQGKTSTTTIDSNPITFKLNSKSFGDNAKHELSEITGEIILDKLMNLVDGDYVESIALSVNNAIPSSGWDVLIAQQMIKNFGTTDGIWKFEQIPQITNPNMRLIQTNTGMANIDGQAYVVSDPPIGF